MDQDDLFVFYFSGHGGPYGTGPEAQGGDAQDEWISLYGSDATPELSTTFSDDAADRCLAGHPLPQESDHHRRLQLRGLHRKRA